MAKLKALISFAVTVKLICAFVFAYADCWFSHAAALKELYPDVKSHLETRITQVYMSDISTTS